MFHNASNLKFEGSATNNVQRGDQYINCRFSVPTKKVKKSDGIDKELTQFQEVIRGNIHVLRILDSRSYSNCELRQRPHKSRLKVVKEVTRTVLAAELYSTPEGKATKATVMTYRGRKARIAWKKDFRTYSQLQSPDSFQLLAINSSEIPALIFHSELVPLAHFCEGGSFWMQVYISHLAQRLGCARWHNVWMDTTLGKFVCGPIGPRHGTLFGHFERIGPLQSLIVSLGHWANNQTLG
ncbi:hypothetical protein Moror_12607 [Moniliophthora roreri MCA 2997]|uniref:Uncharacterized protein n=2 Tax=Moniliophthora roreri TaxID=221103 RepID=V2XT03_MONRO|nr:hypothetical protein Moror_12607 [Moniliophthora roreri MCA 2997]